MSGILSTQVSHIVREQMAAGSIAAHPAQQAPAREASFFVAWEARPKPRPASPANVSKRGLSARPYATNQTLIMVNVRLPKGILAARKVGREPENRREWAFMGARNAKPPVCFRKRAALAPSGS